MFFSKSKVRSTWFLCLIFIKIVGISIFSFIYSNFEDEIGVICSSNCVYMMVVNFYLVLYWRLESHKTIVTILFAHLYFVSFRLTLLLADINISLLAIGQMIGVTAESVRQTRDKIVLWENKIVAVTFYISVIGKFCWIFHLFV